MRKSIIAGVAALAVLAPVAPVSAATDPLATEVAGQVWESMTRHEQQRRCDQSQRVSRKYAAIRIIRKHNPQATRYGRVQLRKAYGHILNQC